MDGAAVLGVALAAAAIGSLGWLWRRASRRVEALGSERDRLQAERDALTERLAREEQARRRQAERLATQARKEDKARRRTSNASKGSQAPLGTAVRIRDLEAAIARTERERDRVIVERDGIARDLARLRTQNESRERAEVQAAAAREGEATTSSGTAEGTAASAAAIAVLEDQLREAREGRSRLAQELEQARVQEARLRKRVANQEQLYAALRGELEAKKDRLRTQTETLERLQALKVAMLE